MLFFYYLYHSDYLNSINEYRLKYTEKDLKRLKFKLSRILHWKLDSKLTEFKMPLNKKIRIYTVIKKLARMHSTDNSEKQKRWHAKM